jgi:S-disulfanyl-L-cysteine oxidoreductase SoxD
MVLRFRRSAFLDPDTGGGRGSYVPRLLVVTGALICGIVALTSLLAAASVKRVSFPRHFANPDDSAMVVLGRTIYATNCASCHGRHLEGQALWQLADDDSWRRAPAHDATGHTWLHSDEDLFYMTKYGRFNTMLHTTRSAMPAFASVLNDHEILASLAFIKSRWPIALRVSQASLSRGAVGVSRHVGENTWRFPLNCLAGIVGN